MIECALCRIPVDPSAPGVFAEVTGWTENRTAGGAHAVALREPTGRYAHGTCIRLKTRGVDVANQGQML